MAGDEKPRLTTQAPPVRPQGIHQGSWSAISRPETCVDIPLACHLCNRRGDQCLEVMAQGHAGFVGGKFGCRSQHSGSLPAPGHEPQCRKWDRLEGVGGGGTQGT